VIHQVNGILAENEGSGAKEKESEDGFLQHERSFYKRRQVKETVALLTENRNYYCLNKDRDKPF
jgi:ABC-type uncharacterized transport system ATPase subunit